MRVALAVLAGLVVALLVAGMPTSAANKPIAAVDFTAWNPADVSITAGDDVTWSNGTGIAHNVCVAAAGVGTGCDEFRSGDPTDTWPSGGYTHRFATVGTYRYICQQHPDMKGTITVTAPSTGTSTTPPPDSQPTDTITVPTPTDTTPATTDTTAPRFAGKPKRRASRKSLVLELSSSEDAMLKTTVLRRPPRGRSFVRVTEASVHVKQGKNVVKVLRAGLRPGAYRVRLQLVDAAGNKSSAATLSFKVA